MHSFCLYNIVHTCFYLFTQIHWGFRTPVLSLWAWEIFQRQGPTLRKIFSMWISWNSQMCPGALCMPHSGIQNTARTWASFRNAAFNTSVSGSQAGQAVGLNLAETFGTQCGPPSTKSGHLACGVVGCCCCRFGKDMRYFIQAALNSMLTQNLSSSAQQSTLCRPQLLGPRVGACTLGKHKTCLKHSLGILGHLLANLCTWELQGIRTNPTNQSTSGHCRSKAHPKTISSCKFIVVSCCWWGSCRAPWWWGLMSMGNITQHTHTRVPLFRWSRVTNIKFVQRDDVFLFYISHHYVLVWCSGICKPKSWGNFFQKIYWKSIFGAKTSKSRSARRYALSALRPACSGGTTTATWFSQNLPRPPVFQQSHEDGVRRKMFGPMACGNGYM